jgi:hypothetical protein
LSCFLTRCALCWFMYLNMLSHITNACWNFKIFCCNYILYFNSFKYNIFSLLTIQNKDISNILYFSDILWMCFVSTFSFHCNIASLLQTFWNIHTCYLFISVGFYQKYEMNTSAVYIQLLTWFIMQPLIRHTLYHNHCCSDMQGNQTLQKNIKSLQYDTINIIIICNTVSKLPCSKYLQTPHT